MEYNYYDQYYNYMMAQQPPFGIPFMPDYDFFDRAPRRPGIPPFPPPGDGPLRPPFAPGAPPFNPDGGPPASPPPSFTPELAPYRVDPGSIRGCRRKYTYLWLTNGQSFWFYPTYIGRRSIAGYRWIGFWWVYFGTDLRNIQSFICY